MIGYLIGSVLCGLLYDRFNHELLFATACTVQGLALSYRPDLPAGPTIILLAAAVYVTVLLARAGWKAVKARRAAGL